MISVMLEVGHNLDAFRWLYCYLQNAADLCTWDSKHGSVLERLPLCRYQSQDHDTM